MERSYGETQAADGEPQAGERVHDIRSFFNQVRETVVCHISYSAIALPALRPDVHLTGSLQLQSTPLRVSLHSSCKIDLLMKPNVEVTGSARLDRAACVSIDVLSNAREIALAVSPAPTFREF